MIKWKESNLFAFFFCAYTHQWGAVGAPVGGQVLSEVLPYLELKKDNETEEEKRKQVSVPNIEGLNLIDASKKLKEVGLEMQIENETEDLDKKVTIVREQLPKQGISVYEGTKILVRI